MSLTYRPEIDGLRALAVLPVILFHAGFEHFSGGFVGVDVFFVISGYLITSIILVERSRGEFSLAGFYERRIRRILPALFLVMAACIPFAWLWLMPGDFRDFAQSLVAVPLFGSNFLFWQETGYFGTAAELKPLLHTWSLAVEEQYYLLFPMLMLLAWRLGRTWMIALFGILALLSLGLAHWGSSQHPVANFFLLPGRLWELLLGGLIALYTTQARPLPLALPLALRQSAALAGLALIAWAVLRFGPGTPFPGLHALIPTLGTALIILFGTRDTWVGRLLATRMLVGLGLISYSSYLWHQPIFAFARHRSLTEPGPLVFLVLSALALGLAWLSWRFVERPMRNRAFLSRSSVFAGALILSLVFILLGLLGSINGPFALKAAQTAQLQELEYRMRPNAGLDLACTSEINLSPECRTHEEPEILLWGDSIAMHLMQGFLASNPDVRIIQATMSACGPFLDIAPVFPIFPRPLAEKCLEGNDRVMEMLEATPSIRYVVMSSLFRQYVAEHEDLRLLRRDGSLVTGREHAYAAMEDTLARIRALGITPVIFSPPPRMEQNLGRCLSRALVLNVDPGTCDFSLEAAKAYESDVFAFLEYLSGFNEVVWLGDYICPQGRCRAASGDTLIYRDRDHLSYEGSALLGRDMDFYRRVIQTRAE